MMSRPLLACAIALVVSACGGPTALAPEPQITPPVTAPPPPSPAATDAPTPSPLRPEAGHNLAILAAACWFGGIWSDAEGDTDETRGQATDARCHDVVRRVYDRDDDDRYQQLRAVEPSVVGDIAARVEALAKEDADDAPRSQTLAQLVQAVASAEREAMLARRAVEHVKGAQDREPETLRPDDTATVEPLKDTRMLDALLKFQAGDLTHDAHALGILAALDHVELGRTLPRRLRMYGVGGVNQLLLGLPIPDAARGGAGTPKRRPVWGDYVVEAAAAAGHPVPETTKLASRRELLAWSGMLEGYADRLRMDIDGLAKDSRLHNVASVVVQRIDAEYRAQMTASSAPPRSR
jgi:hypothetical protein